MKGWTCLNSKQQDLLDLVPAQQWRDEDSWYAGTADVLHQCIDIIKASRAPVVRWQWSASGLRPDVQAFVGVDLHIVDRGKARPPDLF